jgi:hypothetical protein
MGVVEGLAATADAPNSSSIPLTTPSPNLSPLKGERRSGVG